MLTGGEQGHVVTPLPWVNRDGFVAETAVRLDRLQALLTRLDRDQKDMRRDLAHAVETAEQTCRLQSFEETLRNSRELKIDELLRCVKDVKARLAEIEGPRATYVGLTYKSFDAIDAKLLELAAFQSRLQGLERSIRVNAALVAAALFVFACTAATHFV